MKFKSRLAVLIAAVLVLSLLLPACGKKEPANTNESTTGTSQTSESNQDAVEKKEIEMSIALWDFNEFDDEVSKKIESDLKIKITPISLSWDNDLEQIKLFAASGNLPDFVASYTAEYDIGRFYSWLEQGITRTIPEELFSKYPGVKSMFDNGDVVQAIKEIQGNYTFIPRPMSLKNYYPFDQQMIYYRKDWMANVGITKEPETIDEFYAMLRAFTYDDPNKNGKPDTYGLVSARLSNALLCMWGTDPGSWIEEDGKFVPASLSQNMVPRLKFFRKLYEEKILDPEFTQNGYKQAIQKFTTNAFGVLVRNGDLDWIHKTIYKNWAVANPDVADPLTAVGIMAPLKTDASGTTGWPMQINACGTEVSAKVDDEKLDRFLELIEYLIQADNRNILRYGFEGVDYKINNGAFEPVIDPATNEPVNVMAKYPSTAITSLVDWDFDNLIDNPYVVTIPQECKDLATEARAKYSAAVLNVNMPLYWISTPARDTTDIGQGDAFAQIVMGKDDVQVMFDKFVQEAKEKGIDLVIEEVNAKANELGIK